MRTICSNFGSIQPESNVAVWSTSAKPAMSASQALCGFTTLHSILQGTAKIVEAIVAKLHQLSPQARRLQKLLKPFHSF